MRGQKLNTGSAFPANNIHKLMHLCTNHSAGRGWRKAIEKKRGELDYIYINSLTKSISYMLK